MKRVKLLLVDDHALVRSGLRMLLQSQPDMVIVAEAENGAMGLAKAQEVQPDVVLMDITMPDMNGIEATRAIKRVCPGAAVLALTMHEDRTYFFEMLNAGASGYVPEAGRGRRIGLGDPDGGRRRGVSLSVPGADAGPGLFGQGQDGRGACPGRVRDAL